MALPVRGVIRDGNREHRTARPRRRLNYLKVGHLGETTATNGPRPMQASEHPDAW